jgi:hypothetical protein
MSEDLYSVKAFVYPPCSKPGNSYIPLMFHLQALLENFLRLTLQLQQIIYLIITGWLLFLRYLS